MLSEQARQLFNEIQRANSGGDAAFSLEEERRNSGQAGILTGEPMDVEFEERAIAGLRTVIAKPRIRSPRRQLIFLHGGAFALMSPETHSRLAGHLARACRAEVYLPEYSLAPEYPFPNALDECVRFAQHFTESRPSAGLSTVLAGDSAGGGLALSAAMKMRDDGIEPLSCLVLLCPWLDLTLKSQSIETNRERALFLSRRNLQAFANLYVSDADQLELPYVSPLYGSLAKLPPIYLQGAEYDMLLGDAARLQNKALVEEAPLRFDLFPLMPHSFQFFAGTIPEADAAISQIGHYLDQTLEAR